MALDQALIDAVAGINTAFVENADWFPSNTTKLLALIHAYEKALALRPQMASHGGSAAEELRFNQEVTAERLAELQKRYQVLQRQTNGNGGFRQNQLRRGADRW